MNYKIYPPAHRKSVSIRLPLSKSISNRALIINALTDGLTKLPVVADCDDTDAMVSALLTDRNEINVGAAGTAMRFLTAYFAAMENRQILIDGSERMRNRPIGPLVDALRTLGASIEYVGKEGFPPLSVHGKKLTGGEVTLPASVSSQYVSALMMIAPTMEKGLVMRLSGIPVSMPYIIMTVMMMIKAGIPVMLHDNTITIPPSAYRKAEMKVEGDWSAASYWYEIVALGVIDNVVFDNLSRQSMQGDSALSKLFGVLGVGTNFCDDGDIVIVKEGKPLTSIEMDLTGQPDLAQTVVVTASLLAIPFRITGLSTLPSKETDRLQAMKNELFKLGIKVEIENNNAIVWDGAYVEHDVPVRIATYNDHRMAMAFAPAAVLFPGIVIEDVEVVSKSYPDYWTHLQSIGFKLEKCK